MRIQNTKAPGGANAGAEDAGTREQPAMLDVQAVSVLLSCSVRHVYRLCDSGRMPPPIKLGALVRWPRSTGDPTTGIVDWVGAGCPDCRKGSRR